MTAMDEPDPRGVQRAAADPPRPGESQPGSPTDPSPASMPGRSAPTPDAHRPRRARDLPRPLRLGVSAMDAPRRTALEDATAYIRAHRDGYTDPALRERLTQIGYDDAVIDEAFRAAATPPRRLPRSPGAADRRPRALLLLCGIGAGAIGVVALLARALSGGAGAGWWESSAAFVTQLIGIVILAIGLPSALAIALSDSLRDDRPGALSAFLVLPSTLIVLVALAGIGIYGSCVGMRLGP